MTSAAPCSAIQTRRVFYIPGFDPTPARAYRERYRRQSRIQAAHSGHVIAIAPRRAGDDFGWRVTATIAEQKVVTDVTVLIWADIVRSSMQLGILATYRALLATAWTYLASGALFRLMRLRKGPIIAALYPVIVLIVQAVLASGLGYGTYRATLALGGLLGDWGRFGALLTGAASAMGAVVWLTFLRWCQRRDHLLAWYLMHDYAFSAQAKGAYPPAQEARMVAFAEVIAAALATDTDEVLIVGHSSGAILAISVLADLVRTGRVPSEGPHLSLLTLGHVVPMVSFLPEAHRLRADLAYLSACPTLAWVDVTAPGDGCSFALCDPVAVSGVAPPNQRWPLVISAAYSRTLRPATWAALRWRLFEAHFQYLNAFDKLPGRVDDYDYFAITAGPLSLGARFATRPPSPGRITTPANRFPGMRQ